MSTRRAPERLPESLSDARVRRERQEEAYAELMGAAALAREQAATRLARECKCAGGPQPPGLHDVTCPKYRRRRP